MSKKSLLVILMALIIFQTVAFAQNDPFTSGKPKKGMRYPGFVNRFVKQISILQRKLNKRIATLSREIKEKKSLRPFIIIFFITFVFGMVHALGPGHGKTITFSYFLAEQAEVKKGIMVGTLIGFLHALSALVLVLILYFVIRHTFLPRIENVGRVIRLISYGMISGIGLFLLYRALAGLFKKETTEKTLSAGGKSILPFAIAVGLTPCTGAVIVLLFSISLGVLYLGIMSTFFMALGMAFTISTIGILTILAKKGLTKIILKRTRLSKIFHAVLSITGALLITFLGLLLFTSAL
jgi:nickel/cobalt exporter